MTLTQLRYVVAVDRYRHFATAAEKSYITQPTLSMQIHKLEEELGVILFDRSRSPVVPTSHGEELIKQAKIVLKEANTLLDIAQFTESELRGTFRLGVIPTVAPYLLPMFLRTFQQRHPGVELSVEEALTDDLTDKLLRDELDAGLIATPVNEHVLFSKDLYTEPFVGYFSPGYPLLPEGALRTEDLTGSDVWLLQEGHCFRDQAMQICGQVDGKSGQDGQKVSSRRIAFKSGNLETLKRVVEQNNGMTLLPLTAVNEFERSCTQAVIRTFEEPVPSRKIRLVYAREHLKSTIVEAMASAVMESLPEELRNKAGKRVIDP